MYELFEDGIIGGLTTLVEKHAKFNNNHLPDYNENEPVSSGAYFDLNSFYVPVLSGKLPVSNFTELKPDEVSSFDYANTNAKGDHFYYLVVSAEIDPVIKM